MKYKTSKRLLYILLPATIFIMVLSVGCHKDIEQETVEGRYIGETHVINRWANSLTNYEVETWDTLYIDTFYIELIGVDSILFTNKNVKWKFLLDTSNVYERVFGSHAASYFKITPYDSLNVHHYSYGGYGSSFNQSDTDFKGVKD